MSRSKVCSASPSSTAQRWICPPSDTSAAAGAVPHDPGVGHGVSGAEGVTGRDENRRHVAVVELATVFQKLGHGHAVDAVTGRAHLDQRAEHLPL
ncbi:MAG: hypothetical protein IPM75_09815 [Candidatus Competibacteraceae bacterium]|nr:hypothetical protein [Candidatus Competibacteraceae bacterium]